MQLCLDIGHPRERRPFSGLEISAGELLHTRQRNSPSLMADVDRKLHPWRRLTPKWAACAGRRGRATVQLALQQQTPQISISEWTLLASHADSERQERRKDETGSPSTVCVNDRRYLASLASMWLLVPTTACAPAAARAHGTHGSGQVLLPLQTGASTHNFHCYFEKLTEEPHIHSSFCRKANARKRVTHHKS